MADGDVGDEADHFGQFAAGNGGIFEDRGRLEPGQGGKGAASRRGQLNRFGGVTGAADMRGAMRAGQLFDLGGFVGHRCGMTVRLDQQHGFGIQGQSDVRIGLHALDGFPVEKFQGARNDLGRDDGRDGFGGGVHLGIKSRAAFAGPRVWAKVSAGLS